MLKNLNLFDTTTLFAAARTLSNYYWASASNENIESKLAQSNMVDWTKVALWMAVGYLAYRNWKQNSGVTVNNQFSINIDIKGAPETKITPQIVDPHSVRLTIEKKDSKNRFQSIVNRILQQNREKKKGEGALFKSVDRGVNLKKLLDA